MSERDIFLWASFGVFFLALAAEVALLRARARRARKLREDRP